RLTPADRQAWHAVILRANPALGMVPDHRQLNEWVSEAHQARGENELALRHLWTARDAASDEGLRRDGLKPEVWRAGVERRLRELHARLGRP
ncbi:MAG: hypothetical protein KDB18_13585, partial [Salinibacterium sp.]|nr:hypothetical protein [Salinibacterium sp.]